MGLTSETEELCAKKKTSTAKPSQKILTDFPTRSKALSERPQKMTKALLQVVPLLFSEQEADLSIHKNGAC